MNNIDKINYEIQKIKNIYRYLTSTQETIRSTMWELIGTHGLLKYQTNLMTDAKVKPNKAITAAMKCLWEVATSCKTALKATKQHQKGLDKRVKALKRRHKKLTGKESGLIISWNA
jgi:hypothetical protein